MKIKNSKNQNLDATIHYPEELSDKLAILCPGFLDTKDYDHLVKLAETLADHGYTVVRFDPTGTWGSEGDISDYLTSQYLEDIKSVLEHMLSFSDYSRVLLGGHSRGGQVSILYAARDTRISEVIAIMPSHGSTAGQRREEWEKTGFNASSRDIPGSKEQKRFNVPFQHVLDRDQFDALGDMRKITVPIILIAGELDELVPPEEVEELFDAGNEPKKFVVMPDMGHDYRRNPLEIEKVNAEILKFLE